MQIIKTDGTNQKYSEEKFRRSMKYTGADDETIDEIVNDIPTDTIVTSEDLYKYAFEKLKHKDRPLAARYDVKSALLHLGPSGYPFEKYVAEIFKSLGYKTKTNYIVEGHCIRHETDVIAQNNEELLFIECKYHNAKSGRSNIKVPLYIKARFDDIEQQLLEISKGKKIRTIIITNTQFTSDAQKYAQCIDNLDIISWSKPKGFALAELINHTRLHPISALTTLSNKQKRILMKEGNVLCRDIIENNILSGILGITESKKEKIVQEAKSVCNL